MAIYRIISTDNRIIAEEDFVKQYHDGDYELIPEPVLPQPEQVPE